MTDGIIQEVFEKYKVKKFNLNSKVNLELLVNQYMNEIQQELIEKIKQEIDAHFDCVDTCCTLKEHLIGDNQQ